MQKFSISLLLSLFAHAAFAQLLAPRYAFVEHVTNSRCSVCASRNPAMYTLLGQNASQVHHLAYHPSFPYSNCVFYQANTTENNARASFYDVSSTPRVILNGSLVGPATQLLPAATLNAQLNQTSPIYVQVTETATTATVTVHTVGAQPTGSYKLYVALAEKTVNQTTPNGEGVHRDVFRDMLNNIDGDDISLSNTGGSVTNTFTKTSNSNWNADELYVIAWIQDVQTKEIPNSGTKFDPVVSGVGEIAAERLAFSPNPATGAVFANIADDTAQDVQIMALDGSVVAAQWSTNGNRVELDVENFPAGIYFVSIRGEKQTFTGKLVKID
jgi:hypothetical protein